MKKARDLCVCQLNSPPFPSNKILRLLNSQRININKNALCFIEMR